MTTELTKAAQQALACMRGLQQHLGPDICAIEADALERALTQRPAAQTERDTGPRVLREVFALCEDTMDKMTAESTEFSRGRAFEAKGIARAIGTWFQDEYCGQSHMGEPSLPATQQATPAQEVHPLASRCYAMSEPHLSGYRLVLGFETLEAVDAAHTWVANVRKAPQQATPEPSRGMIGMGAHALANELAQAVAQDDADPDGHDMSAGLFGPNVSAWLRKVATEYLSQPATPEPVGEPVAQVSDLFPSVRNKLHAQGFDSDAPLYTRPAPGVPDGVLADMQQFAKAGAGEYLGPNHMALVLKQKINEWVDALAAAQAKGVV